jgi:hypothetical protein
MVVTRVAGLRLPTKAEPDVPKLVPVSCMTAPPAVPPDVGDTPVITGVLHAAPRRQRERQRGRSRP